jgi:hypothetical protein
MLAADPTLAEIKVLTEPARIALVIKDGAIAAKRMNPLDNARRGIPPRSRARLKR